MRGMAYEVEQFPQSIYGILKTLDEHQYHYIYQVSCRSRSNEKSQTRSCLLALHVQYF